MHFLELIKTNSILYSILINGSFSQIDLNSPNIFIWSDKAIEVRSVSIGSDEFDFAMIIIYDSFISIDLRTANPKFFKDPKIYFGRDGLLRSKSSYVVGDDLIEEDYKNLGTFEGFSRPVTAIVRRLGVSDFEISLRFFPATTSKKMLSRPSYYIAGIEVAQEALYLFRPNEIRLVPMFTPLDYAPRIEIIIKNSQHSFLKYLRSKASLSYDNRLFEHGRIPKIDPFRVCGLSYVDQVGSDSTRTQNSMLFVILCDQERLDSSKQFGHISFEVSSPDVVFYKIGDLTLTKTDLEQSGLNLEQDYVLEKTLFGREAVDEFGEIDYYQGISVYHLKKE